MAASHSSTPALSTTRVVLALFALTFSTFAIAIGDYVLLTLITQIADSVGGSMLQIIQLSGIYDIGVVVGGPLLALLGAALPRRLLLILMLALCLVANLATGLVDHLASLRVARFIAGLPVGVICGVAALSAASLVAPRQRGKAVAWMMLGLLIAKLLAAPLGIWIAPHSNWRVVYMVVSAMCVLGVVLIALCVPRDERHSRSSPARELSALKNTDIWLTLAIAVLGFGSISCVLRMILPTLHHFDQFSLDKFAVVVLVVDIVGIVGILAGGALTDRGALRAIGIILLWILLALLLFTPLAYSIKTISLAMLLVGTCVALLPALQVHLMDVGGNAQTLAASLNYAAIILGFILGGLLGDKAGNLVGDWAITGWVGAILALVGLAVFALMLRRKRASLTYDNSPG